MSVSTIRKNVKESMKGKGLLIYVMVIAYILITQSFSIMDSAVMIANNTTSNKIISTLAPWVTLVIQSVLIVGYTNIILKIARGKDFKISELLSGWRYGLKALGLILLMTLYIILWSLLLIVPGIIKAYSYSMAMFIFAEDPTKGIRQCIAESQEMMNGYKFDLFALELVYGLIMYGIVLLAVIPTVIALWLVAAKTAFVKIGIACIALIVLMFVLIWWGVKLEIAKGHFYLKVSGNNNTYNTFNSDINSDCVYSFENMSGTNDNVSNVVSESEYKEVETTTNVD